MSEKILLNETLSALLDNEAGKIDTLELRRLVRAMEHDPELAGCYQRYLLGSAVIRNDAMTVSTDFLHQVQKGIEAVSSNTQADDAFSKTRRKSWLKIASQLAAAASVATVAIIYVQTHRLSDTSVVAEAAVFPENKKLGENADNRVLSPRTLTVSATSGFIEARQKRDRSAKAMTDCVVVEQEMPADSGLRSLQLPEGYILCRMDENRQRCHAVSTSVACYP